jgi:hypothetical protein
MAISERSIPQIVHRYEDPYKHTSTLKAFVNNERVGYLEYVRNFEAGGWNIENIMVNDGSKGRGVGQALLASFVDHIGPDQDVHAVIIHKGTHKTLVERYSAGLMPGQSRDIPEEDFLNLALVRGLRICGINVTKITVGPNFPEFEGVSCNIEFEGRTLPTS